MLRRELEIWINHDSDIMNHNGDTRRTHKKRLNCQGREVRMRRDVRQVIGIVVP